MPGNIANEIDALQQMTTSELAERYEELYGPGRTRHRASLIRKVAGRIPVQSSLTAVPIPRSRVSSNRQR